MVGRGTGLWELVFASFILMTREKLAYFFKSIGCGQAVPAAL